MNVNWIDDTAGVAVVTAKGITVSDIDISVAEIDKKASAENRARPIPLDKERLDGIRHSYKAGIPIPKIFVRKKGHRYIVAGGNHRLNSLPTEVRRISVHCMECTDAEFERICRQLNTVVGEGMTKQQRIEAAIDAVERLGDTIKTAADDYGVDPTTLKLAIRHAKTLARLEIISPKGRLYFTRAHAKALGELANNNNVLRAAAAYASEVKPKACELNEVARIARKQETEASQIKVFEDAIDAALAIKNRTIPRHKRKALLAGLSQLEKAMQKGATWESVELAKEEIPAVKSRVESIRDFFNCLLKGNG